MRKEMSENATIPSSDDSENSY